MPPELRNGHKRTGAGAAGADDAPGSSAELIAWLAEHGRSSLEASVLEACAETGRDEAAFVAQLTRLDSAAARPWFASLPVVVEVSDGAPAGFTCDETFVVDGIQPGGACELAGVEAGWQLDRFQGAALAHDNWRAFHPTVAAAPRPWRFRFLSPTIMAQNRERQEAGEALIEQLGKGRLRVLRQTPFFANAEADDPAEQLGTLSLGAFTRALSSAVTESGVAKVQHAISSAATSATGVTKIQHRMVWSAIADPSDRTLCFEKVEQKDEPSLAFVRAAVAADSEEGRRVRVIQRLSCNSAPGMGNTGECVVIGKVIELQELGFDETRGGNTMHVRHGSTGGPWSPCFSPELVHTMMAWSSAENALEQSLALALLGRTSEDAEEAGGGGTALATNLMNAVTGAKGGKKHSEPAEVAAGIAALLQQRLRSSADQCPPLVQSVLKGLRLVMEVLDVEDQVAFAEQVAEEQGKKKKRSSLKAGAAKGELSRALRRTLLGTVEELQHFTDAESVYIQMLHAVAKTCGQKLKKVDATGSGTEVQSMLIPQSSQSNATDGEMRDSVAQMGMAEQKQNDYVCTQAISCCL